VTRTSSRARECSAYLLATGLAPHAVYGIGVRAVWPSWSASAGAFAERARGGDASVPDSSLEVGVAFPETVGVQPRDCWGVFEAGAGARVYVQIVYRKATDDAEGRARFARYLESIGVTADDLDVGHPEGKIVFSRGRFRVTRH
jgi:hypothetical protein